MKKTFARTLVAALVAVIYLPAHAQSPNAELLNKIESLSKAMQQMSKEMEQLKSQVDASKQAQQLAVEELNDQLKQTESKSLGRWLTVGGDYQFRVDNLRGETEPFTDVNGTFSNAQKALQADFFGNPSTVQGSSKYFGAMGMSTAGALSALMRFSDDMAAVKDFAQAQAFRTSPMNAGLIQGIGGFAAYQAAYKPRNTSLYSNRLGLDLGIKAAQDVSVYTRLVMYKIFGAQDAGAITNQGAAPFFADRVGVFDGTLGHVPSSSYLNVDRAYATWSNIGGEDIWFSVGRRPSTHGAPSNFRLNTPRPGNGGTPALLVDYAFDGMTLGYAPDIDGLPGAYAKVCYGRGFESGFRQTPANSLADTDMLGIAIVPIDTDPLRIWFQWNRGSKIFDAPTMSATYFGNTQPKTNLGNIDWLGFGVMGKIKAMGAGELNYFVDLGLSTSRPNSQVSAQFGFQGLMTGGFFSPEAPTRKTGSAVLLGVRYDLASATKFGFEFNHGSKNWITFAPAASDMWTSKAGTRGNVYEAYVIHELDAKPIASPMSKTFFRLGAQYYDFRYTGSNNWVGAPVRISELAGDMMTTTPLRKAVNVYATAEVKF